MNCLRILLQRAEAQSSQWHSGAINRYLGNSLNRKYIISPVSVLARLQVAFNLLISNWFTNAGDGVVPLQSSHLDGALQITLDSVYHSISTPDLNNPELEWYGSESVVDSWLDQLSSVQSKI